MLELDWDVHPSGGVALVAAVVRSDAPTPRRVRVDVRTDPAWPPRRRGVPEKGWTDGGVEVVVPAGGRRGFGFATVDGSHEPPVAIRDHERVDPLSTADGGRAPVTSDRGVSARSPRDRVAEPPESTDDGDPFGAVDVATPDGLVRSLASPAPPRDGVPDAVTPVVAAAEVADSSRNRAAATADGWITGSGGVGASSATAERTAELPDPVAAWLADVEGRVERVEELAAARDLPAAAGAVERAGGLDGVERLVAGLAGDEPALRAVAERARTLADRTGAVEEIPVDAYRRLR